MASQQSEQQQQQNPAAAAPEAPTATTHQESRPRIPSAEASASPGGGDDATAGVRFASGVDVAPAPQISTEESNTRDETFNEVAEDQIKAFSQCSQGKPLQTRRLGTYHFEAFSLPPSRVPSREDESENSSKLPTPTSAHFPQSDASSRVSGVTSPPLTPSGSGGPASAGEKQPTKDAAMASDPQIITPQATSSRERDASGGFRRPMARRPASSDHLPQRSTSAEGSHDRSHRKSMFTVGAGSTPVSRESSPSRSSASNFYSKPATPFGDVNDPYAKGRRNAQPQHGSNRNSIDSRFVFSRKKKHGSPSSSKVSLHEKRGSGAFGSTSDFSQGPPLGGEHSGHGSMMDLKRFFRKGGHHHKKGESSLSSTKTKTPPPSRSTTHQPFGEDHGLSSKYGKLGRVLGSGAGGSVRLMKRKEDGVVFAVKEFRAQHSYETEKEYTKKVTAEFCVGSTLHHGNIIETLDILQEKGRWFEVMEYAPFDLFAIVMTGKMSREEVTCSFLQILSGVTYLHSVGLAHRDLKLDNVVVSDRGIMKIIDFGSAHVFAYPFETDPVPAKGIVGSDPYLAPEVYESKTYDAAAVDIWSLAIIYCCMTLRRFPWKIPRMTDNSFKLFASDPTPGHDPKKMINPSKSTTDLASTIPRDFIVEKEKSEGHRSDHHHRGESKEKEEAPKSQAPSQSQGQGTAQKETIKGPWRILRLLPRESRHIIHRMLDLNPKTRAKMDEVVQEAWVADTIICQQLEDGTVISADDHTHTLEPPNNPQS